MPVPGLGWGHEALDDLEAALAGDVAVLLSGADAVVFAAGAGAGSGAPRKDSVDRAACVLMAGAAEADLRASRVERGRSSALPSARGGVSIR